MAKSPLVMLILVLASTALAAPPAPKQSPVSAADSLQHFQLPDDLAIELAAAEPEVIDPVDVRFDELGRMYVVEMRDYPLGPQPGQMPLSKIKLLEDRDGDGRYETAFVFAENLLFPTGLQPWKGGVIVTLAGRVVYLKDTDGDHKADLEETWFTGFVQENSQLRANHPRFAHDNHIYIANGLRGGKIVDVRSEPGALAPGAVKPKTPGANASGSLKGGSPIDISGRDFRFDPCGTLAEPVSGVGQYGLCFDDFGHRFVCQNRNPLQHVVFEERDLAKSKHYTPPAVMNDVAAFAEKSKLFPLTKTWTTSNLHENTFTAACGVNIYRGTALPEAYRGLALTCDPTGNLVHAEKMEAWGPTFRSQPLYEDREFLASTDEWFRPVSIENGPDGALYIVDMYRAVIEHPDWVPDELKRRPDERFGDDRGRIYRIVKKGERPTKAELPGKASPQELMQLLAHENAWQRETAQRLLVERGEKDVAEALAKLLEHERPEAVFHSLWTLYGLGDLKLENVKGLAKRQKSIELVSVLAALFSAAKYDDVAVRALLLHSALRFPDRPPNSEAILRLAPFSAEEEISVAAEIAMRTDDSWSRSVFLLGIQGDAFGSWERIVDDYNRTKLSLLYPSVPCVYPLSQGLGRLAGAEGDEDSIRRGLGRLRQGFIDGTDDRRVTALTMLGLAQGLATRQKKVATYATGESLSSFLTAVVQTTLKEAKQEDEETRLEAITLLAMLATPDGQIGLKKLADDPAQVIRIAAIKASFSTSDDETAAEFLARARSESPAVKRIILEGLITRPASLTLLLDAIDKQDLQTTDIDPALVLRIVNVADPALKARAQKLFAPPPSADLQKTLAEYSAALKPDIDGKTGRVHFEKHCATCHKVGDVGVDVAPDISDSRTKTAAQILLDVLQPNRAVDGNYVAYVVTTNDGRVLTGVISAETSQAIALKAPGGMTVVLPRSEIDELQSTGKSLMPEGLERNIPPQEMAQIVSYIKNWRYLDGRVPASSVK